MSEIIIIGIGQCGVGIALEFIKQLNYDHYLDKQNNITNINRFNKKLNVCYVEKSNMQYIPRCLFIDMDPQSIDKIFEQNEVFIDPDGCFKDNIGSHNNFAVGKYTDGVEVYNKCKSKLDRYFEQSDNLAGIILFFSTAGGSGSGIASNLIQYFREQDPSKIVHCNPVYPFGISHNLLQGYNTILAMENLIEITDYVVLFDNAALQNICRINLIEPCYKNYNQIIAESLIQTTASYRFPGLLNGSMKKTSRQLIPWPRHHFFVSHYMPIKQKSWALQDILSRQYILSSQEEICLTDYFTYQLQFRGSLFQMPDSPDLMFPKTQYSEFNFIQSQNRTQTQIEHRDHENIIGFLGNSKGVAKYFDKQLLEFNNLFRRQAFLHHFTMEGMDEMEIVEAQSNLRDLIETYEACNYNIVQESDDDN